MSDFLQPHGLQHTRPPCPLPTPRVYSNSCPLSRWCHPTISSSVIPFSSHLQSFPASGSFQMSQFFAAGGQSIGVSASASVLPMNNQDQFPLGWTSWISLLSKGLSRVMSLLQHHSSKASILWHSALTSIHDYWKNHSFDDMDLCWQSNVSVFLICCLGCSTCKVRKSHFGVTIVELLLFSAFPIWKAQNILLLKGNKNSKSFLYLLWSSVNLLLLLVTINIKILPSPTIG